MHIQTQQTQTESSHSSRTHKPTRTPINSGLLSLYMRIGVKALPAKPTKTAPAVHLELLGDGSARPFIGVHAVPNRLPELLRYPGEIAQAFAARALHHVTGSGALWARLMYQDEGYPHPPGVGSFQPPGHGSLRSPNSHCSMVSLRGFTSHDCSY